MIEVDILRNSFGKIYKFTVKGHADFNEYGKDIICAAVSAISQTAVLGLESLVFIHFKKKIKDGYLTVEIDKINNEEDLIKVDSILETMVLGLKDIAKEYPDNVKVFDRRCNR
ncbi:MAG: ribosomal-processing cysteine protease Prp [Thermoanaerobacteraceae bacterium]